jgi:hypothetical protein
MDFMDGSNNIKQMLLIGLYIYHNQMFNDELFKLSKLFLISGGGRGLEVAGGAADD